MKKNNINLWFLILITITKFFIESSFLMDESSINMEYNDYGVGNIKDSDENKDKWFVIVTIIFISFCIGEYIYEHADSIKETLESINKPK